MKSKIIIGVAAAIAVVTLISSQIIKKQNILEQKCNGINPSQYNFIDCNGYITINQAWDSPYIYFYDHIHEYEIAGVDSKDDYLLVEGRYFVINKHLASGTASSDDETKFYIKTLKDDQIKIDYYQNQDEIPIYTIIDTLTGEVDRFLDLTHVSEADKEFFLTLINH